MFKVYILKCLNSTSKKRYYIGHTNNLEKRVRLHNEGSTPSTRFNGPWRVIYSESFQTRSEAMRREKEIKGYKGGIQFKLLLENICCDKSEIQLKIESPKIRQSE